MDDFKTPLLKRRGFLVSLFSFLGLALSYGTFAGFAGRFLYPGGQVKRRKMYLTSLSSVPPGKSKTISTPSGEKIVVANTSGGIRAYSARCPHLGCQVNWRSQEQDFHCPCHEGYFQADGTARSGPPAKEGKDLRGIELQVEGESIFAEV